jgi:hypothetical protein
LPPRLAVGDGRNHAEGNKYFFVLSPFIGIQICEGLSDSESIPINGFGEERKSLRPLAVTAYIADPFWVGNLIPGQHGRAI